MLNDMPRFPVLSYTQLMFDDYYKHVPDMADAPQLPQEFHAAAAIILACHHTSNITVWGTPDNDGIVVTEHHVRGKRYVFRWDDDLIDPLLRRAVVILGLSSPIQSSAIPYGVRQVMLAWILASWFTLVSIEAAPLPMR